MQLVAHRTLGRWFPGSSLARGAVHCDLEEATFPQIIMCIKNYVFLVSRNKKLYRAYVDC